MLQSSPYVPTVYDFGRVEEDDGVAHPAIMEEYIHGVSLAKLITSGTITCDMRDRCLDAMDTTRIALELTRGIHELNGVGLAHRDISCHNVLLEDACVRDHFEHGVDLRLIDFGTSTDVARADATVLGTGVRPATIPFGAPEMFGGEYYEPKQLSDDIMMPGRNSSSTDVWSIGAIIVFLMWGEYWPQEIEDIHRRQLAGEPVGPIDAERIAEAKKRPIDLVGLIRGVRSVQLEDEDMAGLVRHCTEYIPSMRPEPAAIEATLLHMIKMRGWGDSNRTQEEGKSIPTQTPDYSEDSAARDSSDSPDDTDEDKHKLGGIGPRFDSHEEKSRAREAQARGTTRKEEGQTRKVAREARKKRANKQPRSLRFHQVVLILVEVSFFIVLFAMMFFFQRTWQQQDPETYVETASQDAENELGEPTNEGDVQADEDTSGLVSGVDVKTSVGDYDWAELKSLSRAIEDTGEGEWLNIAKAYNLVDTDGVLHGDTIKFNLTDGTEAEVRVLGFRHDELADGTGKAGITFEFSNVPETHFMNNENTNVGGWEQSKMREWLNSEFLSRLPEELGDNVAEVKKWTNNTGHVEVDNDTKVVTETYDKLWPLSVTEVYGGRSLSSGWWSRATYDAEGSQYQLYTDEGVSTINYGFCQKRGVRSGWWLRSPRVGNSDGFRYVRGDGVWSDDGADIDWGVSPGFCF